MNPWEPDHHNQHFTRWDLETTHTINTIPTVNALMFHVPSLSFDDGTYDHRWFINYWQGGDLTLYPIPANWYPITNPQL